jgi:hypothetical protein
VVGNLVQEHPEISFDVQAKATSCWLIRKENQVSKKTVFSKPYQSDSLYIYFFMILYSFRNPKMLRDKGRRKHRVKV